MKTGKEMKHLNKIPILKVSGVKKRFGGVEALKGVELDLYKGEVLVLLGDNGAGKSTLIKIICGVYKPDGGEIFLDGKKVRIEEPMQARELGIETIFQDLALFDE